jgi:GTP cyclohydrolase II
VVLLTNNPAKLEGLAKSGIEIAGRMSLEAPMNSDNRRYLTAKAARAGHQLNDVITSLAEPSGVTQDLAPLAP